jgi:xanthine dehydrogenase YagT iron-sulfur-binding subunit
MTFSASGSTRIAPAVSPHDGQEPVRLLVNGVPRVLHLDHRTTLLDALREQLGLTGTKKGCDHGQCGACTIHVDGRRVLACLSLAVAHQDTDIRTIEDVAADGSLHPVQTAFLACDALQCGYCTPGQIMSVLALLDEPEQQSPKTDAEIRERMSGNICRCGAYPNIVAAVRQVLDERATGAGR